MIVYPPEIHKLIVKRFTNNVSWNCSVFLEDAGSCRLVTDDGTLWYVSDIDNLTIED